MNSGRYGRKSVGFFATAKTGAAKAFTVEIRDVQSGDIVRVLTGQGEIVSGPTVNGDFVTYTYKYGVGTKTVTENIRTGSRTERLRS